MTNTPKERRKKTVTKNTSTFSTEVSDYNTIRILLNLIYHYGNMNNTALLSDPRIKSLDIRQRTLEDYKRRLEKIINSNDDEIMTKHNIPGQKTDHFAKNIRRNPFEHNYNFLAYTFRQHNIGAEDIIFYCYFLEAMKFLEYACCAGGHSKKSSSNNPAANPYSFSPEDLRDYVLDEDTQDEDTLKKRLNKVSCVDSVLFTEKEIYDIVCILYSINLFQTDACEMQTKTDNQDYKFPLSRAAFNSRLTDLTELGILVRQEDNKKAKYHLTPDTFSEKLLDCDDYDELLYDFQKMIAFFSATTSFSLPGFFLYDKLKRKSLLLGFDNLDTPATFIGREKQSAFLAINARYQNLIDNEVIWSIITAISEYSIIFIKRYHDGKNTVIEDYFLPIKIISDFFYGRQYLYGYKYKVTEQSTGIQLRAEKTEQIIRISDIISIEPAGLHETRLLPISSKQKYYFIPHAETYTEPELVEEACRIFDIRYQNSWNPTVVGGGREVKIHLHFDPDKDESLITYFKKTAYPGEIIEIDKNSGKYDFITTTAQIDSIRPWLNGFGNKAVIDCEVCPDEYENIRKITEETLSLYESV